MVHAFLRRVVGRHHLLPSEGKNDLNLASNVSPYISTPANEEGAPLGDGPTLMRFPSTGHASWAQLAGSFTRSPMAVVAQSSMGIPIDVNVYKNAMAAYGSTVLNLSTYLDSFDIFDVPHFLEHFKVEGVPPGLQSKRRMMQEGTWELSRVMTVGPETSRHTVMGVHVTAVLVAASLFNSNCEGRFHSNMQSNAARNVLQAIARHAAKSGMVGDGNSVPIKNFAFAQSGPRPTMMHVCVEDEQVALPREYFLRPQYDVRMNKTGDLGYLRGRFKAY
eukprot:2469242-Rhodomonas_salina.1